MSRRNSPKKNGVFTIGGLGPVPSYAFVALSVAIIAGAAAYRALQSSASSHLCSSCASMTGEAQTACYPGCIPDGGGSTNSPSGTTASPSGSATCTNPPNWPDCRTMTCNLQTGEYTCTETNASSGNMASSGYSGSSGYPASSGYSGSSGYMSSMTPEQMKQTCHTGCDNWTSATAEQKTTCHTGCDNSSYGTSGSSGYSGSNGYQGGNYGCTYSLASINGGPATRMRCPGQEYRGCFRADTNAVVPDGTYTLGAPDAGSCSSGGWSGGSPCYMSCINEPRSTQLECNNRCSGPYESSQCYKDCINKQGSSMSQCNAQCPYNSTGGGGSTSGGMSSYDGCVQGCRSMTCPMSGPDLQGWCDAHDGRNGKTCESMCASMNTGGMGGTSGGSMQGGVDQCFADCSRGISSSDPRYQECKDRCYGRSSPGGMQPCAQGQVPTPGNPCSMFGGGQWGSSSGYGQGQGGYPGYGNQGGQPPSFTMSWEEFWTMKQKNNPGMSKEQAYAEFERMQGSGAGNPYPGGDMNMQQMIDQMVKKYGITPEEAKKRMEWGGGNYNPGGYQGGYGNQQGNYRGNNQGYYGMPNMGYQGGYGYGYGYQGQGASEAEMQKMQDKMKEEMMSRMRQEAVYHCGHIRDPLQTAWNMPANIKTQIEGMHTECLGLAKTATDPEQFRTAMDDFQRKVVALFESGATCDSARMYVYGMEEGATREADAVIRQTEKRNPSLAAKMKALQAETVAKVKEAKGLLQANDCDKAQQVMETTERHVHATMQNWGGFGGDVFFSDAAAGQMVLDRYKVDDASRDEFQKRGFNAKHYDAMSKVGTYYGGEFNAFVESDTDGALNTFKTLAAADGDSGMAAELARALKENELLKQQVADLSAKLSTVENELIARLSSITTAPETADEIKNLAAELEDQNLTKAEADKIYQQIADVNGQRLVMAGFGRFKDAADPKVWYTASITEAADAGILTGDTGANGKKAGTVRPGAATTHVEAAAMVSRALGVDIVKGKRPSGAQFANWPTWGQDIVAALEESGVVDTAILSKNPGQEIDRGTFARLVASMIPQELAQAGTPIEFTDLGQADENTRAAFEALSAVGIVKGEAGKPIANPTSTVNRAVAAEILVNTIDEVTGAMAGNDTEGMSDVDAALPEEDVDSEQ